MSNQRKRIDEGVISEIMYDFDRTCCVCGERGKKVQIHHIDEDRNNNAVENLAVLCFDCHNETQIRGGFGRHLDSSTIKKYKGEWISRVRARRDNADKLAISYDFKVSEINKDKKIGTIEDTETRAVAILEYVNSLPVLRRKLLEKVRPSFSSGVTSEMVNASYEYIDALEAILVALSLYYPKRNFGDREPHEYFSEHIASRFSWHRSIAEPYGPGTGGTIVSIICCGDVIVDTEKMIEDMALSLIGDNDRFDRGKWQELWRKEDLRPS